MSGAATKMQLLVLSRCQEGSGSSSSSLRQGRDHPDPAELELPFNQLHLHPEMHLQPQVQV